MTTLRSLFDALSRAIFAKNADPFSVTALADFEEARTAYLCAASSSVVPQSPPAKRAEAQQGQQGAERPSTTKNIPPGETTSAPAALLPGFEEWAVRMRAEDEQAALDAHQALREHSGAAYREAAIEADHALANDLARGHAKPRVAKEHNAQLARQRAQTKAAHHARWEAQAEALESQGPEAAGYVQDVSAILQSAFMDLDGNCSDVDKAKRLPEKHPETGCPVGRWITFRCDRPGCPGEHQMFAGCKTLDCRHCVDAVSQQRAQRVWDTCGELSGSMGIVTLTVPPSLRHLVTLEMRSSMRRAAWETVDEWLTAEGYKGEKGGAVYFHPVGSVGICAKERDARLSGIPLAPGDKCTSTRRKGDGKDFSQQRCAHCAQVIVHVDDVDFHPHWNVVFPLVQRTDENAPLKKGMHGPLRPGKAGRIKEYHPEETGGLSKLRAAWSRKLSEMLGHDEKCAVNVHYQYKKGARYIRQALRYYARSFPGWSEWTTTVGGNRYGGLASKRITAFSHAVASSIGLYVIPKYVVQCPCGGEMEFSGISEPMPWGVRPFVIPKADQGPPEKGNK